MLVQPGNQGSAFMTLVFGILSPPLPFPPHSYPSIHPSKKILIKCNHVCKAFDIMSNSIIIIINIITII